MKENIIQQKSFAFAVRAIKAYKFLTQEKKEFILSKQFLRSATSIGANVEEAIGGQSNADAGDEKKKETHKHNREYC